MLDYRVFLCGDNGQIVKAEAVTCAADTDALAEAHVWLASFPLVEVWHLARVVGKLKVTAAAPLLC
jgi:hypothetical protein